MPRGSATEAIHPPSAGSAPVALTSWLNRFFRERVSPVLRVRADAGGGWVLELEDSPARVLFPRRHGAFYIPGSDPTFSYWDPLGEGLASPSGAPIPAPGLAASDGPIVCWSEAVATMRYDLPGLVHWALARVEEIGRPERDLYGRFDVEASHAWRHDYLGRPFVDEWVSIVRQIAQRLWPRLPMHQPRFQICPSHDVDEPSRYAFRSSGGYLRALAGDLVRRRAWADAIRSPVVRWQSARELHPWDPYNTFDWIMRQSEERGLRSAFYFICGRTDPARDADYEPTHPAIGSLMRRLHRRGHEIGLHPSYGSLEHPQGIADEAQTLRTVAAAEGIVQARWGGRMHYLRWSTPSTARAWADAGLDYDSTLGYGAAPGFRCGTCHEYQAFDAASGQELALRLRPLVAMDATVTASRYMNLGLGHAALARFLAVRRACEAVRGSFTLLWHNSELQRPQARWLYRSILAGHAVDEAPPAFTEPTP